MAALFFAEDVVANADGLLAVVERTHGDPDTHEPSPNHHAPGPIQRPASLSLEAYRKFLRDGVPPLGTVYVQWVHVANDSLVYEHDLTLVDRSLLIGDVVKRHPGDAASGIVLNTVTKCTLRQMGTVDMADGRTIPGLLPPYEMYHPLIRGGAQRDDLLDFPASNLCYAKSLGEQDLVLYQDWIGQVHDIDYSVTLRLTDNLVVVVPATSVEHMDSSQETLRVGDLVLTGYDALSKGKWVRGAFTPRVPPYGTVMQVEPMEFSVRWLQRRDQNGPEIEPHEIFKASHLESDDFVVYDKTLRPRVTSNTSQTISNSEIDVRLGMRVRLRDHAKACAEYDSFSSKGELIWMDETKTCGYDMNVFDVVRFQTTATIQWQDLSITVERSTDLVPDLSLDDEHAAWPGEIAHTIKSKPIPDMEGVEGPDKVGVVQSVKADERLASIRWCPRSSVHYAKDLPDFLSSKTMLTGVIERAGEETDEVSLYDIETPAQLNVRRGDLVQILRKSGTSSAGDSQSPDKFAWIGEIIDTNLDGTLTVRLGAARPVRDVVVCREDISIAVRSDGNGLLDLLDEEMLSEDEDGSETETDDEDWEATEARAWYEDENGQRMAEEDVEDDEWESDDDDDGMNDAVKDPEDTSPASNPTLHDPHITSKDDVPSHDDNNTSASTPPDPYLILDTPVAATHAFFDEENPDDKPARTSRIRKEHKILRSPGALPSGVYVRTWESRLDLIRTLIIGPAGTPYADAPFLVDFHFPAQFPTEPPQAHFHSWPGESGLGAVGRVNPNLYEDGKICLSLLGTWEGSKGEGWSATRSTLLQVVVSLLGLVLVPEPYFNEAGYEPLAGLESSRRSSVLYNERTFLRSRGFVITALGRLRDQGNGKRTVVGLEGMEDVVMWNYDASEGPGLARKVLEDVEGVLERSERSNPGGEEMSGEGLFTVSKGACIPLRRVLERLKVLQSMG